MIIFHEGLPGSGKSYEAAINQIIPALQKGRMVYAYIEGLNHEKFAEVSGIPLLMVKNLLRQLTKEQVKDVQTHVTNDSLVIIDELQDFFPVGKATLDSGVSEFVTQHRHRGIDIVCMGQDHRDCHMLWKRRIDTLIRFVKRDAIGQHSAYTWTTYKQQAGKFVQLRSGKGTYDKKNFGLYASHTEGVESIDAHKDDRTNVFKSAAFTFYIPVFLVVLSFAGYYLYGFLSGRSSPVKVPAQRTIELPQDVSTKIQPDKEIPTVAVPQVKPSPPTVDEYLEKYLTDYRPRLVGIVESKKQNKMVAWIEFLDSSDRVFERLSTRQIAALGFVAQRTPFGFILRRGDKSYVVTAFPVDVSKGVTRHPDDPGSIASR